VPDDRLRFGVLGAAWIADKAILDALHAAGNAEVVAIASRDRGRAEAMARRHAVPAVRDTYDALLDDDGIDAVYIGLVNSAHREWTLRALSAGKHVLCEKPLALSAAEAREMAVAAAAADRILMEAFMYRFHPQMVQLRQSVDDVRHLSASFSFRLTDPGNVRLQPALGGGALYDIGCYTLDVARWFLGEPHTVQALLSGEPVDMTVSTLLGFDGDRQTTTWASFDAPEHQELVLVERDRVRHITQPFTSWRDPHDPYQLMIEAFSRAVLNSEPAPRSLEDSIGTAELIDRVRAASATRVPA